MNSKISICVPTWECYGYSEIFTSELFDSIKKQTFDDYEVCISDQSSDDTVLNICEKYANYFKIKYFKNSEKNGGPANTNSAIDMAEGEIIKILFQDDLFYSQHALKEIFNSFQNNNNKWLVSGCNHVNNSPSSGYYNYMIPKWNSEIIRGVNTISSPSVLSIKNDVKERFDSNVPHLMDCEYYYSLYSNYGDPLILENCHITNRMHENQHSHMYVNDDDYKDKFDVEVEYCLNKHNLIENK